MEQLRGQMVGSNGFGYRSLEVGHSHGTGIVRLQTEGLKDIVT